LKNIKKWLINNNIEFEIVNNYIVIYKEKNCCWINGYNEKMYYDKKISIYQNTYKEYIIGETIGYNLGGKIYQSGKQTNIIEFLNKKLI